MLRPWHTSQPLSLIDVAPTSGMVSPFRQKFLEIDRRQGGDVAPPSWFICFIPWIARTDEA
jgi:hypothetical protein